MSRKKKNKTYKWVLEGGKLVPAKNNTTSAVPAKEVPCHYMKGVFKCEDVTFFGGSWRWDEPENWDGVLLDLDDRVKPLVEVTGFSQEIRDRIMAPAQHTVKIDWPDFGVPSLDRDFWIRLTEALLDFKKDVLVACFSGHGRTGSCLSIIAGLLGFTDPVAMVRSVLCSRCIETPRQMDYVARITGLDLKHHAAFYGLPAKQDKDDGLDLTYGGEDDEKWFN